jgi:hypothetical protein
MDIDDEALAYSGSENEYEKREVTVPSTEKDSHNKADVDHSHNNHHEYDEQVSGSQSPDPLPPLPPPSMPPPSSDGGFCRKVTNVSPPSCTLYVSNFIAGISARRLATVFEPYGKIEQVSVKPPRQSDGFQYAFIAFREEESVATLLEDIETGKIIDGGLAKRNNRMGIKCERAKDLPKSARNTESMGVKGEHKSRKGKSRGRGRGRGRGKGSMKSTERERDTEIERVALERVRNRSRSPIPTSRADSERSGSFSRSTTGRDSVLLRVVDPADVEVDV